jgi:hypothetical protein
LQTQTLSFFLHLSFWHYFRYVIKNLKCPFCFTQAVTSFYNYNSVL